MCRAISAQLVHNEPMHCFFPLIRGFGILLLLASAAGHAAAPRAALAPEVQAFVEQMVERHGFERETLVRTLRGAKFLDSVVRAMEAPATALPWHEFRQRHIGDARIQGGLRFWAENAVVLERAAAEYRVPPELIVATIGIETVYGRRTGSFSVLDALVTLAFGYPQRAAFFRDELEQFLPSSYRKYAVDFDGDGRRDLRRNADAIGSVANYYREFGWQSGAPVIVPVDVGETALDPLLAAGIAPHATVAEFGKRGVVPLEPVPDDARAALIAAESAAGMRYWLGLNNFYVITRYNRSINYALVVQELAASLREQRGRAPERAQR